MIMMCLAWLCLFWGGTPAVQGNVVFTVVVSVWGDRGTPTVQGNAVFTLAGLAVTVAKYASGLDDVATATDSTGYVGMPQWIVMVTNTLMSIADVNFRPTSRILPMCKQVNPERH